MKLQVQPNRWSCFATSVAMVLDIPLDKFFRLVGHDGSENIWPNKKDPHRRRGIHPQEAMLACAKLGYSMVPLERNPFVMDYDPGACEICHCKRIKVIQAPFDHLLPLTQGVMRFGSHAVAWDGKNIFDPNGTVRMLHDLPDQYFWISENHFKF